MRKPRAHRTFCINPWPSASPSATCSECESERKPPMAGPNDLIEVNLKANIHQCMQYQTLLYNILNRYITKCSRRKIIADNKSKMKYSKSHKAMLNKLCKMYLKETKGCKQPFENSILDAWSTVMNKNQLSRQTIHLNRFFFTTCVYISHTCHMFITKLNKRLFSKYLIQCGHSKAKEVKDFRTVYVKTDNQSNINLHDCGIHTMHHM
ncbi:hypothetical protein Cgig2_019680 [Carnegiea gigantea]|uniref:Uncharacterized protein n=1 Tax=Carnegiea gigantea TaxID=171969 RepID=A0A9Q1K1J4_9CARY|nr:hypothetical protein Cgig2_019680 [Carnegiea gigantea]